MPLRNGTPRRYASLILMLVLTSCGIGCFGPHREWTDDLVWSPDGRHAGVLRAGLRIADVDGNLSPQLDDRVYRLAWLDTERLLLARTRRVATFGDVAAAVGPERTREIAVQAEHAWTHVQSRKFPQFLPEIPFDILILYLREHHLDALRDEAGENWTAIENATAELHQLVVARVVEDRLEFGVTLSEDVIPIKTVQPSPDRRSVAFVTRDEEFLSSDGGGRIEVVPIDGSSRPRLLVGGSGDSLGWSPDSRALLYFFESGWDPNIGRYGCLNRHTIVDPAGAIEPEQMADCLCHVIFERSDRVFALRDGRVLFESMGVQLPGDTVSANQLFVVRREPDSRYPMIDRYPVTSLTPDRVIQREGGVTFFDVSPDRTRAIYATGTGAIRVLTLENGRTELLLRGVQTEPVARDLSRPVWSGPDAFTYVKKIGARNEFILRRGGSETVLSRKWPPEMLWRSPPD